MKHLIRVCVIALLATTFPAAAKRVEETPSEAKLEFENPWVRVVRVHLSPYQRTERHAHPGSPTIYVYLTDGGRLSFSHSVRSHAIIRPPVKAGGIRYQRAKLERHKVEELDGIDSEYLRVELKIKNIDPPLEDIRIPPSDSTPYESRMVRISRVTCEPYADCPAPAHPGNPSLVVFGNEYKWMAANAPAMVNQSGEPMEQVRIDLIAPPESNN